MKAKIKAVLFASLLTLSSPPAHAYSLVTIMGVSSDKKSLYINRGEADGDSIDSDLEVGVEGTFTVDNISVVAKAVAVTEKFSQWRIVEPGAIVPFEKDQIVTFNHALEKVWMLDPDKYSLYKQQLDAEAQAEKDQSQKLLNLGTKYSYHNQVSASGLINRGLSTSISEAASQRITAREGTEVEIGYARMLTKGAYFGSGFRRQTSVAYSPDINTVSTRFYWLLNFKYHFIPYEEISNFYIFLGTLYGIGPSRTHLVEEKIVGTAQIFPAVNGGIEYYFKGGFALQVEGGFETIAIKERFADGEIQESTEVNYRGGVSACAYF